MKKISIILFLSIIFSFANAQEMVENYWKNKKLESKGLLKEEQRVGMWEFYTQDGVLFQKANYVNGFIRGEVTYFYEIEILE